MKDIMHSKLYSKYFEYYKQWKVEGKKLAGLKFRLVSKICADYFNKKYPKLAQKQEVYGLNTTEGRKEKIIVSLTSFPKRIDSVWICISTILRQSVKPDAVELWLSKEQFSNEEKDLPQNLLDLKEQGLSICFCEDDLRSHKKYYYAMQNHPDDIVITCDDDVIYHKDTIKDLFETHTEAKNSVISTCTAIFSKDDYRTPITWGMASEKVIGQSNLCVVGCGGVLYPPNALHKKAFDKELIRKICPFADDLWLSIMTYVNGKTVSSLGLLPFPLSVGGTQEVALTNTNNSSLAEINNDTQWQAILSEFSEELKDWESRVLNG